MFMAGLSGGRVNKFNVLKQARQYDPEGEFVRTWIPELERVPTTHVHTPWLLSAEEARDCGAAAYFDNTHDLVTQQLPFYFGAMSSARKELVSQLSDLKLQNSAAAATGEAPNGSANANIVVDLARNVDRRPTTMVS